MRAYYLTGNGLDGIECRTAAEPEPGPGDAIIRVGAASLNYRDLILARGPTSDRIPLSDGAGEVVALGGEVGQGIAVGDRVMACFSPVWTDGPISLKAFEGALGGRIDGMLAEYVSVSAAGLVRIPQGWTLEEAATLPCAAVTAWNALNEGAKLSPGQTVVLLGTGGVSMFGLQLAKLMRLNTVITSKSDDKLERMQALGADVTINYSTTPDWELDVLEATQGEGADLVLEVGGADTLPRSMAATRIGGEIAVIGSVSGEGSVNPRRLIARSQTLRGVWIGSRRMFEDLVRAIDGHPLRPVIDAVYSFDHVIDAYRHLESQTHVGKVVVRF